MIITRGLGFETNRITTRGYGAPGEVSPPRPSGGQIGFSGLKKKIKKQVIGCTIKQIQRAQFENILVMLFILAAIKQAQAKQKTLAAARIDRSELDIGELILLFNIFDG